MREEFEKLAAAGKLGPKHIEPLVALTESGYCLHKHWGFGKILSVDTVFGRFMIDFPNKPGHAMDLAFAVESLKPIPKDHILALKVSDPARLRELAARQHLELIKLVLQSFGGKAPLDQIQHLLVPDVISSDWKKWWETARREMRKDGHYQIPAKKTDPIVFQAKMVTLSERLMAEFRAAKGLQARTTVASEVLRNLPDLTDRLVLAGEIIPAMNAEITTHLRTQAAVALDAIFVRDDLAAGAGLPPAQDQLGEKDVWSQGLVFGVVMDQLPAVKHRRALQSFRQACPETWVPTVLNALNTVSAKLCTELAHLLTSEGKLDLLKDTLARLVGQHRASSELLLWLARERSDTFAEILGPEVFRAMLTAMERDQFNEKRSNRLGDFILSDRTLLAELIESADLEVVEDLTRALKFSPCFDGMDKGSLLARILKIYPSMQSLISSDQSAKQDMSLIVSWESLERRKQEYDDLVHKKLPANTKEIAIARGYGDLSENFEYKAAKDMQKLLSRQKQELEYDLGRARGMDFLNPRTDAVNMGTMVTVRDLDSQQADTFSILGAWDTDPERGIISYLTPVAQAVLNHKVGEEVQMDLHGAIHRYRIEAIEAHLKAPPTPAGPDAPPAQEATVSSQNSLDVLPKPVA
ncbi:MAG: GreA/GreB family elongation factor [Verrucomicrobia bacterium]|nr:GreA/GreB family elongation factor [Verrucomicrobiota bacterium]